MDKTWHYARNVGKNSPHTPFKIRKKIIGVNCVEKKFKAKDFPSIDIALNEARLRWELEYSRLSHLDNKAVSFVTIAGILLAFLTISKLNQYLVIIAGGFLLVTIILAMISIWPRAYYYPTKGEGFFNISKNSRFGTQLDMVGRYTNAIEENIKKNDKKAKFVNWSGICLVIAIFEIVFGFVYPLIS